MQGFSKHPFVFHSFYCSIPHINSETNSPPPLSMLFASIWESFLAQTLVLLLCQYAATVSRGKGPDLFLQSESFQNWLGLSNLCEILQVEHYGQTITKVVLPMNKIRKGTRWQESLFINTRAREKYTFFVRNLFLLLLVLYRVIAGCTVEKSVTCKSKKVYLEMTEQEFKKQRYYCHVKSFKNEFYANSTTLPSYVWEFKKRNNVTPAFTWEV